MDLDDDLPRKSMDAAHMLAAEDLDPLSQEELDVRIALLKAEIVRVEARKQAAGAHRANADALFRKS